MTLTLFLITFSSDDELSMEKLKEESQVKVVEKTYEKESDSNIKDNDSYEKEENIILKQVIRKH